MLDQRLLHGFGRHAVVHMQRLVNHGLHVNRLGTAHHEATQHGLVRVSRHGDLVTGIDRGHHHALVAAGRAVDQKVTAIGAVGFSRQLLRFEQRLGGLQQVVDPRHRREIDRQQVVADEFAERQIHADALFVAGRMKRNNARIDIVEQRLKVRSLRLVHRYFSLPQRAQ